jgi:hypothetical protein
MVTAFAILRWLWSLGYLGASNSPPMPRDLNITIAASVAAAEESDHPKRWAAELDVFARFETGYRDVAGDCPGLPPGSPLCTRELGARSCGPWQTPCRETPQSMSLEDKARLALRHMKTSALACPKAPLSIYATGVCAEHSPAMAFRMSKIRSLLLVPMSTDPSP